MVTRVSFMIVPPQQPTASMAASMFSTNIPK
jgi:hypothetical protein